MPCCSGLFPSCADREARRGTATLDLVLNNGGFMGTSDKKSSNLGGNKVHQQGLPNKQSHPAQLLLCPVAAGTKNRSLSSLKQPRLILAVLENLQARCQQSHNPFGVSRKGFFLASYSFWGSQVFLGLWPCSSVSAFILNPERSHLESPNK